jgi:hypothetical protein
MQFNLPLHNNPEVRKRQRTKPKRIITMNNLKLKTHHLLPKINHSGNRSSHVLFVVTITTLETIHIMMKWPNFSRGIPNPSCLLSLFLSNNLWLFKPPLQGAVPATLLMMKPQQVPIFIYLMGLI